MNQELEELIKEIRKMLIDKVNNEELIKVGESIIKAYYMGRDHAYVKCIQIIKGDKQ